MQVEFKADNPVTDPACKKATGRTLKEWFAAIDSQTEIRTKRRDTIHWVYESIGQKSPDVWWPTTIWVEYERANGIVNKKDGRGEGYNICSTKSITAPVADVYAAFVNPKSLKAWFGNDTTAKVADGGKWSDGDGNSGEYLRVRENKDLRFTWMHADSESPTQVDVVIADKGKGKTMVTLTHQRIQNRPEADGLRNSWSAAFNRLKALLE
jgi:uncharacterized protein YndB with AHSA1/START domain